MSWLLAILSFLQFIHQRCTGSFGRSQLSRRASQRTTQNVHTVLRDGAGRRYMANWMARVTEGSGFEFRRLFFMASRQRRTEGGWGGVHPLPPQIPKAHQNRAKLNPIAKTVKIDEFMAPTQPRYSEKDSKILKLPPVRNCFTLAMPTKLVVFINSLKVPKIKKLLLYEMKFLVPNYNCLQNPWLGGRGLPPPDPRSLSFVLNWICWTPNRTKFLGTPLLPDRYRIQTCKWGATSAVFLRTQRPEPEADN